MHRFPRFCHQCGGSLFRQDCDGWPRPVCSVCGLIVYLNPVPSVAAILMREGRVLLVKRNVEPGIGEWCLPGGFIELTETPEMAIKREVLEETGFVCDPTRLLGVKGVLGGFYGDIVLVCYHAEILYGDPVPGADAEQVDFFPLRELPSIAFREHQDLIQKFATGQEPGRESCPRCE